MNKEDLLEKYNNFYQYYSYEAFEKLISDNKKFRIKFKEANKGLNKLLKSRKVWKNRYYREKGKRKNLIKYIEDRIKECNNTLERLEGTGSHRIPVLSTRIYDYQDLLEKIKSGKYE